MDVRDWSVVDLGEKNICIKLSPEKTDAKCRREGAVGWMLRMPWFLLQSRFDSAARDVATKKGLLAVRCDGRFFEGGKNKKEAWLLQGAL